MIYKALAVSSRNGPCIGGGRPVRDPFASRQTRRAKRAETRALGGIPVGLRACRISPVWQSAILVLVLASNTQIDLHQLVRALRRWETAGGQQARCAGPPHLPGDTVLVAPYSLGMIAGAAVT
jgi:hypothetical protein